MGSGSFKQSHFAFCWDLYRILGFSPAQEQGRARGGGGGGATSCQTLYLMQRMERAVHPPTSTPIPLSFELWSS